MAARTKGQKLAAKRGRGRPAKEGVPREANGRPSRAKEPPAKVAQLARMRIFGLTASEALSQDAADNLGRLYLAGKRKGGEGISQNQYNAAERYREIYNEYRKSRLSPDAYYERSGIIGASDPDEYDAWVKRCAEAWQGVCEVIDEAQREVRDSSLWDAVEYMLQDDIYMPHMLGDIRLACNALYRHFFTQKRRMVA